MFVYTIQWVFKPVVKGVVKPVSQPVVSCIQTFNPWQTAVSCMQPVVKPVVQPAWQPVVSCKRGLTLMTAGELLVCTADCECNGHAASCHYDDVKRHGVCDSCVNMTTGDKCQLCVDFYRVNPLFSASPCADGRPSMLRVYSLYIGWSDVIYLWSHCDRHFVGQHVVLCVVKWWRFVALFN